MKSAIYVIQPGRKTTGLFSPARFFGKLMKIIERKDLKPRKPLVLNLI